MTKRRQISEKIIVGGGLLLLGIIVAVFFIGKSVRAPSNNTTAEESADISSKVVLGNADAISTQQQLNYLIEEEKLAHDVYTKMYEKYGKNVFGNILSSESTHQYAVLALLNARQLNDPRSDKIGFFNNTELQQLYDKLIAKGNISAKDAYEVGVAIEEKDIADISKQLETAKDADVISTLESLRKGSENHLRAFNRQL